MGIKFECLSPYHYQWIVIFFNFWDYHERGFMSIYAFNWLCGILFYIYFRAKLNTNMA